MNGVCHFFFTQNTTFSLAHCVNTCFIILDKSSFRGFFFMGFKSCENVSRFKGLWFDAIFV